MLTRIPRERSALPARWTAALMALVLAACRAAPAGAPAPEPAYRIIGYVGGRADIHAIGAHKLTHVNYAFAQVSTGGEIVLERPGSPSHLAQLQALKARNSRLRILLSVGGWGADNFSDAALTDESRARFAHSAAEMIRRYALDGIDLDWEYPGQPGPGIRHRPEDRRNFTLLLAAVRDSLDALSDRRARTGEDRYLLTIASAGGRYFEHTEMDRLHVHLDWINIMTYDFYTGGSRTTGHHSALFRSAAAPEAAPSTEAFVRQHLAAGIPPRKLVIGAAFYGRGWTGVEAKGEGLFQPHAGYAGDFSYSRLARDYIDRRGFQRRWDATARAPYLWNPDSATLISYDDPESLRAKAEYVRANGLGGVMYWEQSHDPNETLLDALVAGLR